MSIVIKMSKSRILYIIPGMVVPAYDPIATWFSVVPAEESLTV